MDGNLGSNDEVVAKLIDMGFEGSQVMEAIEVVGPSLNNAIDHILKSPYRNSKGVSTGSNCSAALHNAKSLGKRSFPSLHPYGHMRQSSIMEHLQSGGKSKKNCMMNGHGEPKSNIEFSAGNLGVQEEVERRHIEETFEPTHRHESSELPYGSPLQTAEADAKIGPDWDQKANRLLHKHFGYKVLKSFQKEALGAWLAHQDCLVLAATGSGITVLSPL